uniref:Uncharacterized protein n=1 Tax=Anguilla anguilla TaxID=7936 RepID=A0A0E9SQK8_ANGAN
MVFHPAAHFRVGNDLSSAALTDKEGTGWSCRCIKWSEMKTVPNSY